MFCVSTTAKLFQIVYCRTQSVWAVFSFPRCSVYNLLGVNLLHLDLKSECLVLSRDEMTIFDAHVSIILGARRRPVWKSKGVGRRRKKKKNRVFQCIIYEG